VQKYWTIILFLALGSSGSAKDRKPDIVSIPANLDEYYTFVNGKWVWNEDLKPKPKRKKHLKGIVTLGKTTIRYIPDNPPTPPKSKGN
jgi:hypothetical protein